MSKKRTRVLLILCLLFLLVPAGAVAGTTFGADSGDMAGAAAGIPAADGAGSLIGAAGEEQVFADVKKGDWFYTPVMELAGAGIVSGMGNHRYEPRGNVTYGQALKLILMAVNGGRQEPSRGGHWAGGYLSRALADRVLDASVPLDKAITRLEIAEIAARAMDLTPSLDSSPFNDLADGYATALYKAGIISGSYDSSGNRLYKPKDKITRAEISTIIYNLYRTSAGGALPAGLMPGAGGLETPGADRTAGSLVGQPSRKIVGYYAAWAKYSGYSPDQIDGAKLTHINYAFANIGPDNRIAMGYPDIDPVNFKLLNNLKKTNPNLKTLISVGGWTWSARFSDAALTDASRTAFADSCVAFIKKYGFDGVDLDWEYPVGGGLPGNKNRPEDKRNFTLLLKTLREKLDAQGRADGKAYLLTIAGGAGTSFIQNTELSKIAQYVDYASVMAYDIHGRWDSYTDLHAPLYKRSGKSPQLIWSADSAVQAWLASSFPKDKLVMGIPFYGYQYTSADSLENGLHQSYSKVASISYQDIVKGCLGRSGYTRYFDEESKVPWLYNGSNFICYEDAQSVRHKTDYINSEDLAGAMIWELSQDYNRTLLEAVHEGLE